jgi:hypothetical protein
MTGDVVVTSLHGDIVLTEESGWIETDGRIVLTGADIDIAGVIKNAAASPETYEVVIDPSNTLTLTGDVDAFGSILITVPTAFTLRGSVEAGGVETFAFLTDERGFLDGGNERVRIEAPSIDVDGGTGTVDAEHPIEGLNPGDTYPLGAQIVASGLIELIATESIDVSTASQLIVRHSGSLLSLEAPYVDILGSLYAGANPNRVLMGEEPGITWAGGNAGIQIVADNMVTFGGEDAVTDLDVYNHLAAPTDTTMPRG